MLKNHRKKFGGCKSCPNVRNRVANIKKSSKIGQISTRQPLHFNVLITEFTTFYEFECFFIVSKKTGKPLLSLSLLVK